MGNSMIIGMPLKRLLAGNYYTSKTEFQDLSGNVIREYSNSRGRCRGIETENPKTGYTSISVPGIGEQQHFPKGYKDPYSNGIRTDGVTVFSDANTQRNTASHDDKYGNPTYKGMPTLYEMRNAI